MKYQPYELEEKIRNAFECTASLDVIPAEQYAELNSKIFRCEEQVVKKYLPLLLIKEMKNPEQHSFNGTGDHLVYFLDGYLLARKSDGQNDGDERSYELQVDLQKKRFAHFSHEQAKAIHVWLKFVALPKYQDLCPIDLESAIKFWSDKTVDGNRSLSD